MNAGEDNPAIAILKGKGTPYPMRDTFRVLYPDAKQVGTGNGGYTGRVDGAKIDYVLASPGIQTLNALIDAAPRNGRYPSDHYPVIATMRVNESGCEK